MKLSMWMIANQLLDLDPVLEIAEDAPAILNSARLAYATNCVYIYQEGNQVVCNGEGDRIIIRDMELNRVFELIQAIFDSYEDWMAEMEQQIRQKDYQGMTETAHKLLKNPLILFDANSRVLGITREYGEDALDPEWAYIYRYGYSSINALNMIRYSYSDTNFYDSGQQPYQFGNNKLIQYPGISASIYFNEILCGRMNLLSKNRPLNQGDSQMLASISKILEASLGQLFFQNAADNSGNIFLNILLKKPYDAHRLQAQLAFQKWHEEDTFYITLVQPRRPDAGMDGEGIQRQLNYLLQLLSKHITHAVILYWPPNLVLFSTENLLESPFSKDLFQQLVENNPVQVGASLPSPGLFHTPLLFHQAEYAIERGDLCHPEQAIHRFRDYAIDYLLTSDAPLSEKIFACMPEVRAMWEQKKERGDEMFHTLKVFLDCERSVPNTAAALYLHRNTVVYRIKKIQNLLQCDLDDSRDRQYCWLSIHILELSEEEDKKRMG